MDDQLHTRDEFLTEITERLQQAQSHMKDRYDQHHRQVEYAVDDWVWLPLQHRQAANIATKEHSKLAPRYYGPYRILEHIGSEAYRLELPARAKIHNVFHVALLKTFRGSPPTQIFPLPEIVHGQVVPTPAKIVRTRLNRGVWELLVQWQGLQAADATWEKLQELKNLYPMH